MACLLAESDYMPLIMCLKRPQKLLETYRSAYAALQELTQNALVSACVRTVADDMVRNWIDVTYGDGESDAEGKENDLALTAAAKKYDLQAVFHEAALMSGFFGGYLVYIDTGEDDPQRLR